MALKSYTKLELQEHLLDCSDCINLAFNSRILLFANELKMTEEYFTINDAALLAKSLATWNSNQKLTIVPYTENAWTNLHFQDYTSANDYNFAIHKIT
ncbi:hypothetical protein BDK51DRAFT_52722 [Blyttiomyces helicus]|uniref:Uncharacterized protein n=1 Tax=Blyttiomyces helicus TaxID=388810 RepID=A0A4P9WD21_9FUNG|nr:hypothetical protein BDK51DRAFT_52722 [Blyttiomyces helicus]|eukprot:RKO89585.1 hypothetical protein BDK51DRAFT_52722 [Blyttiomyces helicus]